MDGIFISNKRPASKKAVKAAVAEAPETVVIEGTSLFGNPYTGPITEAPAGRYDFVGPDPYTLRKFYGTLTITDGTFKVS